MAMVEFSVVPLGTQTASVSKYVAKAIKILDKYKDKIKFELTPMGTIIEGDLETAVKIVLEIHNNIFSDEVQRVVTNIKIDDRRDKELTLAGKVKAVMDKV